MISLFKNMFRSKNRITMQVGGIEENYGIGRVVKGSIQFNDASGSRVEAVTNVAVRVYKPNGIGVAPSLFATPTVVELDDANTVGLFHFEVQLPSTFDETLRGSWIVSLTGDADGQSPASTVGFAVSEQDTDTLKTAIDGLGTKIDGVKTVVDGTDVKVDGVRAVVDTIRAVDVPALDLQIKASGVDDEIRTHILRIPAEGIVGVGGVVVTINLVKLGAPEPGVLVQIASQTTSEVLFVRSDDNGTAIVNLDPGNYTFTFFQDAGKFIQRRTVPTGILEINFEDMVGF